MSVSPYCIFTRDSSPIVAAAIHNGHDTRPAVQRRMALSDDERLREEDPITGSFAQVAEMQIVGLRSRFEVDLNRPREDAVYESPEDAWGLDVWKVPPDRQLVERSLEIYDQFYADMEELLNELIKEHGRVVVLDLHAYNHRREGPDAPPAPVLLNPEINVGTGSLDRELWAPLVERFIRDLRGFRRAGRPLDVRENVKFFGGEFSGWIHRTFPQTACALAIEIKKTFMDEWDGDVDLEEVSHIFDALASTLPGLREELERLACPN